MDNITLQEVIRQNISLPSRSNSRGFYPVLCKVCNDHGKKGLRAGFKFEGEEVGYNCFNCSHTARYDPSEHESMPGRMIQVLNAFGIEDSEWAPVVFHALRRGTFGTKITTDEAPRSIEPASTTLPSCAVPLVDDDNEWNQFAIEYLQKDRAIDWTQYQFYIVNTPEKGNKETDKWYGRLIIPIYKDKKLIFYQGRDLSGMRQKKYLNPAIDRDTVMYGFDHMMEYSPKPLYVVEGWFDAFSIQGVAVLSNKMSTTQIKWLKQSPRQKIIVPDRYGDGYVLAQQALELDWGVSYPDIGSSCKDINDAIVKYGKLYTLKTLHDNTCFGFDAEARLGIYCNMEKTKHE